MRRTIYLPDDLAEQVEAYLREHPRQTLSSLVRDVLAERLRPPNTAAILDLEGLVKDARTPDYVQPEDEVVDYER